MEVDRQAPVCEAGKRLIQAPAEVVWDTLTDIGSWPRWMPGVKAGTAFSRGGRQRLTVPMSA
ncbi:MAG: SRPBCC family protein [Acidimicrobiia bacterium]|nr:SRPBCC family protein [Acidimicrobiia bacterium]